MGGAAHFVLDREQVTAGCGIDDVAEAVLILVALAPDQIALAKLAMRSRKIRDVDLHMVAVIVRLRPVGFAELEILVAAHLHMRDGGIAVPQLSRDSYDLGIESANALRGADRHVELDIGDAERDAAEARGVRLVAAHAIAPWTSRFDMIVVLAERERGAVELFGDRCQPAEQGFAARDDEAGMAAQHLRLAARQMKLAAADVDPHVA